jgi:hypothetical protein
VSVHGPPRLHFESLKLLNYDFNADPDPAFPSNVNPDPASRNYGDSCGSGSATLFARKVSKIRIRDSEKRARHKVVFKKNRLTE